jgi:hypothetical protein
LPGAVATPCKTWLKVNDGGDAAFTGSSLSGSLTFAEGTKQIGNDKATNDDSGLFSGGNNININNLILPSSLEKVGKSTF